MATGVFESGRVIVEINILRPERLLNILWSENIKIINVKRVDAATIRITIEYSDYKDVILIVKKLNGKCKIVGSKGRLFLVGKLKKKLFLCIGGGIFFILLLYFSTFVWSIEITTKQNVSPYEIRQQLYSMGIKPGIRKKSIDFKDIEKKLENGHLQLIL